MKNTLLLCFMIMAFASLAGCSNTADGIGKDLQGTGEWFEDTF